jgi:hypothetical protein
MSQVWLDHLCRNMLKTCSGSIRELTERDTLIRANNGCCWSTGRFQRKGGAQFGRVVGDAVGGRPRAGQDRAAGVVCGRRPDVVLGHGQREAASGVAQQGGSRGGCNDGIGIAPADRLGCIKLVGVERDQACRAGGVLQQRAASPGSGEAEAGRGRRDGWKESREGISRKYGRFATSRTDF